MLSASASVLAAGLAAAAAAAGCACCKAGAAARAGFLAVSKLCIAVASGLRLSAVSADDDAAKPPAAAAAGDDGVLPIVQNGMVADWSFYISACRRKQVTRHLSLPRGAAGKAF